jgi:deoxyribonuclease-4
MYSGVNVAHWTKPAGFVQASAVNSATRLRIGIHASIGGGFPSAVRRATESGSDCFQIFARNPRGWEARPLDQREVHDFRDARAKAGLGPLAIHSVYLINLAAQDPVLLARSRAAFREEIIRALELGADYLVVHPGSSAGATAEAGIETAVESIRVATRGLALRDRLTILIENTAGQGYSIGSTFEQVAEILARLRDLPVSVCLDTAHTLAAGYDISTEAGLNATIRSIDASFGFGQIKLVHCNDSKAPLGSRVDRHEHIGLGFIGAAGFRRLAHTLKFRNLPLILETPVDKQRGYEWNVQQLRKLGRSSSGRNIKSIDERKILPTRD